jgi:hypothetical protein
MKKIMTGRRNDAGTRAVDLVLEGEAPAEPFASNERRRLGGSVTLQRGAS